MVTSAIVSLGSNGLFVLETISRIADEVRKIRSTTDAAFRLAVEAVYDGPQYRSMRLRRLYFTYSDFGVRSLTKVFPQAFYGAINRLACFGGVFRSRAAFTVHSALRSA